MDQLELTAVEEMIVETSEHEFELSLAELDFVGGGSSASVSV